MCTHTHTHTHKFSFIKNEIFFLAHSTFYHKTAGGLKVMYNGEFDLMYKYLYIFYLTTKSLKIQIFVHFLLDHKKPQNTNICTFLFSGQLHLRCLGSPLSLKVFTVNPPPLFNPLLLLHTPCHNVRPSGHCFPSTKTLKYFTRKLWLRVREHADQEEMACISVSL